MNVCGPLVSSPPLAVPPSSWMTTVTVAVPKASAAGVKVSVPSAATAGCDAEQGVVVVADDEIHRLRRLVRTGRDRGRPRRDRAGPRVLEHCLVRALGEARRVVDGVTVIVNVCGATVSTPPLAVPPLSWMLTVTVATPNASGAAV